MSGFLSPSPSHRRLDNSEGAFLHGWLKGRRVELGQIQFCGLVKAATHEEPAGILYPLEELIVKGTAHHPAQGRDESIRQEGKAREVLPGVDVEELASAAVAAEQGADVPEGRTFLRHIEVIGNSLGNDRHAIPGPRLLG